MTRHYFAYGSNLHRSDFERWCSERDLQPSLVRLRSRAWLPDHEPVFHYRSNSREGGALDVRPRVGTAVPGAVFEVEEGGWALLDRKEGVDVGNYRREPVTVLGEDGEVLNATTYRVVENRREGHVPPRDDYLALVKSGLEALGLPDDSVVAAASARPTPSLPSSLFVYGTLMRGEVRGALLEGHGPREIFEGDVPGRLLELGWYPGLVRADSSSVRVKGELYVFDRQDELMVELDEYEDFLGYTDAGSLYHRTIVRAQTPRGERLAWTYHYVGEQEGAEPIVSGSWRLREDRRRER